MHTDKKHIYIFGASTNGKRCHDVCRKQGVPVEAFLDNDSGKTEFCGLPVLRPEEADRSITVVVTSPSSCVEIMLQLDWLGFQAVNLTRFYSSMRLEPDWAGELSRNRAEYGKLRDSLSDRHSRAVFDAVVMFRKTLDPVYPATVRTDIGRQWIDPEFFRPGPHVFVDGGAYDGDTGAAFIGVCPDYRAAYLFEPSRTLAAAARERMQGNRDVTVFDAGLFGMRTSCFLEDGGTPSGHKGVSGEQVLLEALDGLDIEPPTFIKLDVEGCEIEALAGAKKTIAAGKPMLAVAVYHKPEDLWQVPQAILGIRPDYRLFLRHYTQFYHETVLYCV